MDITVSLEELTQELNVEIGYAYSPGVIPSGNKEITSTEQVSVREYATAQVVDSDLIANNIRKDINILGVVGTYDGGITPTGTINITSNGTHDVTNYANANVSVACTVEGTTLVCPTGVLEVV